MEAVVLLQEFLALDGQAVEVDGIFGAGTDTAVKAFQLTRGLVADGIVGPKTWSVLVSTHPEHLEAVSTRFLSEEDLVSTAEDLEVELAAVKAVNYVESSGTGFLGGRPRILFEGHWFWRRLKEHGIDPEDLRVGNDDILYRLWTTKYYLGGLQEHSRLEKARTIHESAALESASWGLFQILGVNYRQAGYRTVQAFVADCEKHERNHLRAFARFITAVELLEPLRHRDWRKFARGYNGPNYATHHYHTRLERAYRRFKE